MENEIRSTLMYQASFSPPLPKSETQKGGWRSIKYILGNETFEKLASMSLIANITVYLRTRYNMDGILLVNVISIWSGSTNLTSIPGAFLSDTYLGRFQTLLYGSIASFLGMGIITSTASIPELTPPACAGPECPGPQNWQLGILFLGLGLLAIGAGGIRPCNIAFGADQFDTKTPKGKAQLESFFNWWYFSFTVALVVALTCVVYIQTNVSWVVGFAIPTGCIVLSITIFLMGYDSYIIKKPQGSVFIDIAKVITAAWRKRRVTLEPGTEDLFYDPPLAESELESETAKLPYTNRFRCLDKAAVIVNASELDVEGKAKNSWKLCTLLQVEQLKMLVSMFPVWVTGILCFVAMDQQNTIGMLQAIQTNKKMGNLNFPPGWMGLVAMLSLSLWIFFYERICVPLSGKLTGKRRRMNMRQRVTIGILMAILSLLVSGYVERKRRLLALERGTFESPMSVLALIPQFTFSGLTEAFAAVALMEFLTTQLPESMRTVSGAIFFLSLSIASYLNSALVNIVYGLTSKHAKAPWLGGTDLNKNTLECFYFFLAGFEVLNLIYFNFFAHHYISDNAIGNEESENDERKQKMEQSV